MSMDDVLTKPGHLIRRAQQIAVAIFVDEVAAFDITPVQYACLVAVRDNPGADATRISALIAFDRSTLGLVLERLEAKMGSDKFQVVAVNIDTRDPEKPKNFLKEANLTKLGNFSDASARVFQDLKSIGLALGMPTSVLIDGKGCQIANMAGPAEWDSDDAVKLIQATIAQ